jgi:hypothetical protein
MDRSKDPFGIVFNGIQVLVRRAQAAWMLVHDSIPSQLPLISEVDHP